MKWCNALDLFLAYPSSKIKIYLNEVVGTKIGGAKVIRYVILDFIDGHYVSAPTQPFSSRLVYIGLPLRPSLASVACVSYLRIGKISAARRLHRVAGLLFEALIRGHARAGTPERERSFCWGRL